MHLNVNVEYELDTVGTLNQLVEDAFILINAFDLSAKLARKELSEQLLTDLSTAEAEVESIIELCRTGR